MKSQKYEFFFREIRKGRKPNSIINHHFINHYLIWYFPLLKMFIISNVFLLIANSLPLQFQKFWFCPIRASI